MIWPRHESTTPFITPELPEKDVDLGDMFWLEPEVIERVDSIINNTRLSTMELGAVTREEEFRVFSDLLEGSIVSDNLNIDEDLRLAIRIGYMYGSLIAQKTAEQDEAKAPDQYEPPAEGFKFNAEAYELLRDSLTRRQFDVSRNQPMALFAQLRDLEVKLGKSDVLAYSMMKTHDHVLRQFELYGKNSADYSETQTLALQTVFYGGALAGALLFSSADRLQKDDVEIMRGVDMMDDGVAVSVAADASSDVVESIKYALRSKLSISYINPIKRRPYFAVVPNGFQYSPNGASLPLFIAGKHEDRFIKKLPADEVRAMVVVVGAEEEEKLLTIVPYQPALRPSEVDEELAEDDNEDYQIAALITEDKIISQYHAAHPDADTVKMLAEIVYGDKAKDKSYIFELTSRLEPIDQLSRASKNRTMALALASVWAWDIPALVNNHEKFDPSKGLSADIAAFVGLSLVFKMISTKDAPETDVDS